MTQRGLNTAETTLPGSRACQWPRWGDLVYEGGMDLVSQCALRVTNMVWRPGHGGFAFTVVCKATFDLQAGVSPLAEAQDPVTVADVPGGEGGGLALASDLVPFKKRPEVLVSGHAHAPDGVPDGVPVTALTAR